MRPYRAPNPGQLFEITTRVGDQQLLLRPSKEVNEIIVGVIGRGQLLYDVEIHAFVFMSTHYHMLLTVASAERMSKFIGYINCNITKKLNHLNERTGSSWQRRFRSIGVSPDRATQQRRLRYLLCHGVKERLVRRAKDWPGASSLPWLCRGEPIRGVWTSFTARYYGSRNAGYSAQLGEFQTVYVLKMTVLPCWRGMAPERWRGLVIEMVRQIDADAVEERQTLKYDVLGVEAILSVDPRSRLPGQSRSRAPAVHALDKEVRDYLRLRLWVLRALYEESSQRFRAGERDAWFPPGMFRPSGGFVPHAEVEVGIEAAAPPVFTRAMRALAVS